MQVLGSLTWFVNQNIPNQMIIRRESSNFFMLGEIFQEVQTPKIFRCAKNTPCLIQPLLINGYILPDALGIYATVREVG